MKNLLVFLSLFLFSTFSLGSYVIRMPSGTVLETAATSCPVYTIAADGSSLLRTGGTSCGGGSCAALFSAISTTYGAADGTHFTIPDGRGVFRRGAGSQTISAIVYTGNQGTSQTDATKKNGLALTDPGHTHTFPTVNNNIAGGSNPHGINSFSPAGSDETHSTTTVTTGITLGTGDSETRPAAITTKVCIWY